MGTITVKYKTKKQLSTLKKVLEALEFDYEEARAEYTNPSPSGDTWWDEPENYYAVLKAVKESKTSEKILLTEERKKKLFGGLD